MSRHAFQDLATAMKKLGLNPTETEIQDLINEVEMNGYIYYPEFCRIIMRKMREDDEENFFQELTWLARSQLEGWECCLGQTVPVS